MASFAAQAALRSKWTSLVEEHTIEVPAEVSNKVTSVVGWLKQVLVKKHIFLHYKCCKLPFVAFISCIHLLLIFRTI